MKMDLDLCNQLSFNLDRIMFLHEGGSSFHDG